VEFLPKNTVFNRFLVLFLLLSFLLISMAVLPIFIGINASNSIDVSQSDKPYSAPSLGLAAFNSLDYLAVENYYYQIGSGQAFQSRKLLEDRCATLSSALTRTYSATLYSAIPASEIYGQFNSTKVAEFLHAKDGMI